jgi:hypothetical protein
MIPTRETEVFRVKTCPTVTSSTTNLTWTVLASNPGLRFDRTATEPLSYGTADVKHYRKLMFYIQIQSVPHSKQYCFPL